MKHAIKLSPVLSVSASLGILPAGKVMEHIKANNSEIEFPADKEPGKCALKDLKLNGKTPVKAEVDKIEGILYLHF